MTTPDRRQSKASTIDKHISKIDRNSVFDCHLSPVGRQMAIENTVFIDVLSTFRDSIDVFDCRLPAVMTPSLLLVLYIIDHQSLCQLKMFEIKVKMIVELIS